MSSRGRGTSLAAAFLLSSAQVLAEPAQLYSTLPFLPQASLEDVVKEIFATAKLQNRILDQAGWRLRVVCDHHALPPDWVAGAAKPMFAWTCLTAWEQKTPVVSSDTWAIQSQTLITGNTDGDEAALRARLRLRLYDFLQLKPPNK
jgi:hypothetical protein